MNIKYWKILWLHYIPKPIDLRPPALSKHKANLYSKQVIIVDKEASPLLIELFATNCT